MYFKLPYKLQVDIVTVSLSQRTAKLAKIRAVYLDLLGLAILAQSVPDTHFLNKNCTLKGF